MSAVERALSWLLLLVVQGIIGVALSFAHPSHESYAELEWDDIQGTLNVALKVIPEDLERALTLREGKPITLRNDAKTQQLVRSYLLEHFYLGRQNESLALSVEGIELAYRETWLYFSVPKPRGTDPVLTFTVLMDTVDGQINRARRLWYPSAPALVFRSTEPSQPLKVLQRQDQHE